MKKIFILAAAALLMTGCITIQLNVASNVNNVTVQKGQITDKGHNEMKGSQLEDIVKDSAQKNKTDATIPTP